MYSDKLGFLCTGEQSDAGHSAESLALLNHYDLILLLMFFKRLIKMIPGTYLVQAISKAIPGWITE